MSNEHIKFVIDSPPPDYETASQQPQEIEDEADDDDDLNHLFPEERKYSHSVQNGQSDADEKLSKADQSDMSKTYGL